MTVEKWVITIATSVPPMDSAWANSIVTLMFLNTILSISYVNAIWAFKDVQMMATVKRMIAATTHSAIFACQVF